MKTGSSKPYKRSSACASVFVSKKRKAVRTSIRTATQPFLLFLPYQLKIYLLFGCSFYLPGGGLCVNLKEKSISIKADRLNFLGELPAITSSSFPPSITDGTYITGVNPVFLRCLYNTWKFGDFHSFRIQLNNSLCTDTSMRHA